jgi:predicted enzyme related to lactoylglutathione lyase
MKINPVAWFEIPVVDMERAKTFYKAVFQVELHDVPMPGTEMAVFDSKPENPGSGGALIKDAHSSPSAKPGLMVYFYSEDVSVELGRVEDAGGQVAMPKISIGEFGWIGSFIDTEGNLVSLHSRA